MNSSHLDEAPDGTNRHERSYAGEAGCVQQEANADADAVSPPAMVLRSGRKKRKERDSAPPSPASVSSAKKSRSSLSIVREQIDSDTARMDPTRHDVHQHALPISNTNRADTTSRRLPEAAIAGRRLSDVFLPSLVEGFSNVAVSSVSTTTEDVTSSSNPLLGVDRRPPSTPMELAFGDTSTLHAALENKRDEGRRDGLSQVLLRQTTQSSLKFLSQNVDKALGEGPTLFTTHSSILRPLPTRQIPIISETSAPIMVVPATKLPFPTNMQVANRDQMERPVTSSSESVVGASAPAAVHIKPVPDSTSTKYHPLQDWKVWTFLFAGAHILFTSILHHQPYIIPFWKSIPQRAENQLFWYQRNSKQWGFRKDPIDNSSFNIVEKENMDHDINFNSQKPSTIMNKTASFDNELERRQSELLFKRLLLQEYRKIKSFMQDAISTYGPLVHDSHRNQEKKLPMEVEELDKKTQAQMKLLQEWEQALAQVEVSINAIYQASLSSDSRNRAQVDQNLLKKALNRLKKISPFPIDECDLFLFDMDHLIQNLSESKCDLEKSGGNDGKSVPLLSRKEFDISKNTLIKYALNTADKLADALESNKLMDDIIRSTVDTLKQNMIPYERSHSTTPTQDVQLRDDSSETNSHKYLTLETVRVIIYERLERNKADFTGKLDYASIRSGAKVIRSGPRKSSKSLSEDVPLLNRFLAITNLRFYGHKAEAALTPTFPRDALGQCWSFVKEPGKRKIVVLGKEKEFSTKQHDLTRGAYATMSIRLASPVLVSQVVVEHPIYIASSATSAIQYFRIFGFEDDNASNQKSWYLGSFKFDIYASSPLQQFQVSRLDSDGLRIPHLRSIVLAVDSNWGADFSCLYRFRVHSE